MMIRRHREYIEKERAKKANDNKKAEKEKSDNTSKNQKKKK
ncbi:MAG: hypothetical protein PWQ45_105 [Thermosipho sp. (in: thermotogales)]|nr:hypothetical protein [Thermosipho sp. (in: thermotogales)]